jgi:hypothetical protein
MADTTTPTPDPTKDQEKEKTKTKGTPKEVALVDVSTKEDMKAKFAGTWYEFKAGIKKKVPEEFKEILRKSKSLEVI